MSVPEKSTVMINGETEEERCQIKDIRVLNLGQRIVCVTETYGCSGIGAHHDDDDDEIRIQEKPSKGCKTLHASAWLGIRRNGLTMAVRNVIIWAVIILTVTFGCESWVLSEKDRGSLMNFQTYSRSRVQRYTARSLNSNSFYGLE